MKNYSKRMAAVLSMVMVFVMAFSAVTFAAEKDTFLALGADLDAEGTATVLDFFDVDDLEECDIVYITNEDEHRYLDGYVSAAQIGTQALSSVKVDKKWGDGIKIKLHNINYCTEDMYRNALATAGVKGAKVTIAGPYEISGTAALVGTIKAYENMTGEEISDETIDAAVQELTTTGDLGEEVGDMEAVEGIIADLKDRLADDPDMTDNELYEAISDAAEKAGIVLSGDSIEKIKKMLEKFKGLDIDWGNVKDQSAKLLKKVGDSGILDRIIEWVKSFF